MTVALEADYSVHLMNNDRVEIISVHRKEESMSQAKR